GDAGGASKRSKERATQNGNNGRSAAELSEQALEHADEAFGGAAFGEKITRQGEQRDGRQRRVGHHRIVGQRNRRDGSIFAPKKNQGRAAEHDEDRRAQDDRQEQRDDAR